MGRYHCERSGLVILRPGSFASKQETTTKVYQWMHLRLSLIQWPRIADRCQQLDLPVSPLLQMGRSILVWHNAWR